MDNPSPLDPAAPAAADLEGENGQAHALVASTGGFKRGLRRGRNLSLTQPLRFILVAIGVSPSTTVFNRMYQLAFGSAVLAAPVLLFYMAASVDSKITNSTMAGMAILSLAPLISHISTMTYIAKNYMEDEMQACMFINPAYEKQIRTLTNFHAWGGLALGTVLVSLWEVNVYLGTKDSPDWDSAGKAVFALQVIAVSASTASFLLTLILFSIICNIIRLQAQGLIARIQSGAVRGEQIVYGHHHIKVSVVDTYRRFSQWIFPSLIIFVFSIAFQIVGYLNDRHDRRDAYNGAYYLILPTFVIIFLIVVASTITSKVDRIKYTVGALIASNYAASEKHIHVLEYLRNCDDAFKIFGIPISSTLAHFIVFLTFASVGAFVWESIH